MKRWAHLRRFRLAGAPALAVAAAVTAAVAGCTSTSTPAGPARSAPPALTTAQARAIFAGYAAATARAARTSDSALALAVVTGVQRSTLAATLKLSSTQCSTPAAGGAAFSGGGCFYVVPLSYRYTYGTPDIYLPEPAAYPRFFLADVPLTVKGAVPVPDGTTGAGPGGLAVPVDGRALMVFEQASGSAAWLLASSSRFPAGLSLPRLATDGSGYVPRVPLSAATLLARPDVTGPLQAAVVDDGPASAATRSVAAGPLTTGLYQLAREHIEGLGLEAPRGDIYQWNLEGTPFPAFALRTASGGALVLYAMYLNSRVAVPDVINKDSPVRAGPPIAVPGNFLPLLPAGKTTAPRQYLETQQLFSFAAVDPPAGTAKVRVIAVGGGPDYATSS